MDEVPTILLLFLVFSEHGEEQAPSASWADRMEDLDASKITPGELSATRLFQERFQSWSRVAGLSDYTRLLL